MAYFETAQSVADIATLRTLTSTTTPSRRDGSIIWVTTPDTSIPTTCYKYHASLAYTERLPGIVTPNDSTGTWIAEGQVIHNTTAAPTTAPPIKNMVWRASLSSPSRVVTWISNGVSSTSDWIPLETIVNDVSATTTPTFNPDYVGQLCLANNDLYVATGTSSTSDWKISSGGGGSGFSANGQFINTISYFG